MSKLTKYSSYLTDRANTKAALEALSEYLQTGDGFILDRARLLAHLADNQPLTEAIKAAILSPTRAQDLQGILEQYGKTK